MDRQPIAQSLDSHPPSPISADEIILRGPSDLPDPGFAAYRRDLADRALASRVIASHYADAVHIALVEATHLKAAADESSDSLAELASGDLFRLLESKLGWAWGYGGADARVGYVRAAALSID